MSSVPVFVGLDYHSGSVQVCVTDGDGRVLHNSRRAPSVLEVRGAIFGLGEVRRVAIEACCGAADFGDHLARATGWRVSLAHPGMVSRMRASIDKSDRTDARVLADLCRTGYLPEVWLAPEPIRELRTLVRRRQQLTDAMRNAKLRIKALLRDKRVIVPHEVGARWTLRHRRWLEGLALPPMTRAVLSDLLADVDHHLRCRDSLDTVLEKIAGSDEMIRQLLSIKGVGMITACTLRAVVGRFDRFRNGKQFARYCGLTPRNASSGERVADAGLVRAGDPMLKTMLIQLAHRVVRYEPRWRELQLSMLERGKAKCAVIAAVANRWTRRLWHTLKLLQEPGMQGLMAHTQ